MHIRQAVRGLVCGAVLAASASIPAAWAEGTFEIPAGAHFNPDKLAKIDAFFENEIKQAKIPGAVVLIQQHGKPVYSRYFGVRDTVSGQPMTALRVMPPSSAAIWLADSPSDHNFLRSSTRSSVQLIGFLLAPAIRPNPSPFAGRRIAAPERSCPGMNQKFRFAVRHLVPSDPKATLALDSGASFCNRPDPSYQQVFL